MHFDGLWGMSKWRRYDGQVYQRLAVFYIHSGTAYKDIHGAAGRLSWKPVASTARAPNTKSLRWIDGGICRKTSAAWPTKQRHQISQLTIAISAMIAHPNVQFGVSSLVKTPEPYHWLTIRKMHE